MKISARFLFCIVCLSVAAQASFKTVMLEPESEISLPVTCQGSDSRVQLKDDQVTVISASGRSYSLNLDEQSEGLPIMIGSSGEAGKCVLAIKYAENDVNESFSLFVFDDQSGRYKKSAISTITNPEFSAGKISSNYRDGPVTHNDTLCFSVKRNDYYVCEAREQFAESIEKKQTCDESSCSESEIVRESGADPVSAVLVSEKTYLLNRNDDLTFSQRKAYLVRGDKVLLSDYYKSDGGMYYKITYEGKAKAIGWVPESSLKIDR